MIVLNLPIDMNNMTFVEAFMYSKIEKVSFTVKRYSEDAQNRVQFYVIDNKLYIQDAENKPKLQGGVTAERFKDVYTLYVGEYKRYDGIISETRTKFEKLQKEVEPLYNKFKEYEKLKKILLEEENDCWGD